MLPMLAVRTALGELLAADATTIGPVVANKVHLFINELTPTENTVVGDLTVATFTGNAAKATGAAPMLAAFDPATDEQIVTLKEPAGGWFWETADAVNLPQTIYGAALIDNAGTGLLGIEMLDEPITLTGAGQQIDLGSLTFRFVLQPMS